MSERATWKITAMMGADDPERENPATAEEAPSGGMLDRIAEVAGTVTTGVPPQMQRSFFKAFNRVFTAGAEWPAKYLEGRGKIVSAKAEYEAAKYKADTADLVSAQKAREVVNRESVKQAVKHFVHEDLSQRALEYHASHILGEQKIREEVIELAANDLKDHPSVTDSHKEIDDDWLTAFLKETSSRTSEEYKVLFARILSGEIRNPGSFSIGTVQSIARMSQETAELFQRACNVSSSFYDNKIVRIVSESFHSIGDNQFTVHGLSYSEYSILVEEGLLRGELSESTKVRDNLYENGAVFEIGSDKYFIKRMIDKPDYKEVVDLAGPSFTTAGTQLRSVVTMEVNITYVKAFANYLRSNNMDLFRVVSQVGSEYHGEKVDP